MNVELDALASSVDALSDALLAESTHHVVLGNPSRAAATLDALERGEAPPPELEVIRTPRTGSAFTHRVVALFPGAPAADRRLDARPFVLWRSHSSTRGRRSCSAIPTVFAASSNA